VFTLQSTKGREFRRSKAIRGIFGPNGSGKSALAVWDLMPSLDAGRPVLSTARLLDWRNPRDCDDESCTWPGHPDHGAAHPAWVPFQEWQQLIGGSGHKPFRDGDVFLDEVAASASSRSSGSLPFQVERDLQQLRKRNVTLTYTAPALARTEKIIRECSVLFTMCHGAFPVTRRDDVEVSAWKQNRLLRWESFDAVELEKFTMREANDRDANGRRKIRPVVRQWFRLAGCDVLRAYDTMEAVEGVGGWASESGMCLSCGGRRSVPRCSCAATDEHVHDAAPAAPEGARTPRRVRAVVSVPDPAASSA